MEYQVRRIRKDELNKLLELYSFLNPDDIKAAGSDLEKTWSRIMENNDKFIYLVIEDNNKIISSCNISIIPKLTRGSRPFGIIENVITDPGYRRKGLGSKIIKEAIRIAKDANCGKVILLSNYMRAEAHKFYEKLGFDPNEKKGFVYTFKQGSTC
jgi:GNAT superfamily N-acetyltransferase